MPAQGKAHVPHLSARKHVHLRNNVLAPGTAPRREKMGERRGEWEKEKGKEREGLGTTSKTQLGLGGIPKCMRHDSYTARGPKSTLHN